MTLAMQAARKASSCGEVPVGAVVMHGERVIAIGHNQTQSQGGPDLHAEMVALRLAGRYFGTAQLPDCDLYVTLEPCAMCAQALANARIRRLYFAAGDAKGGAVEHGVRLFDSPACHHRPEIYGGIQEREAAELLTRFFQARR